MKTEETLEVIDIIDDDVDVFGDRASTATIDDTGGPRWVGPVAAIALIAMIGYGVATSASGSGAPKVAPAPSTTIGAAPTTTEPAPTTTEPIERLPYYSADPPREYQVQYAELAEFEPPSLDTRNYQLWATPDATATSGSWFSIEGSQSGPQSINATDAYRIEAGGQSLAISHTYSGHTITQVSISETMSARITSFGWSDENLERLAYSLGVSDSDQASKLQITDPSLISGYEMLTFVEPWLALVGIPTENVSYAAGPSSFLSVSVALRALSGQGGSTLDRQIALRFFFDRGTPFDVNGHIATAGEIIGQPGQSMATWIAGDHIVSVAAQLPVPQLISIARTVHQVSPDEWNGMRFQATRNSNEAIDGYSESVPMPVSFGTDADGKQWTLKVGVTTFSSGPAAINWQWDHEGFTSSPEDIAKIYTVVTDARTYVMTELPRAVAPTARLQISREGVDAVLVPFADTDPSFDRTFAAYAFSEPGQYTAQILGPDGAVLATWPTT